MVGALVKTLAFAVVGQLIPACISVPLATEKYYDLCGTLGFLSTTAVSLLLTPALTASSLTGVRSGGGLRSVAEGFVSLFSQRANTAISSNSNSSAAAQALLLGRHPRQWIASACVALWSARLGSYLFARIHKSGRDPRFDEIKHDPFKFCFAWTMQGVWVALTALPVYLINAEPASAQPALGATDALALFVWAAGFGLEVVADRTKAAWRSEREQRKHKEKFLSRGVWSWCRHPNYFGEITLWTGLALLAISAMNSKPLSLLHADTPLYRWLPVISPAFEYALIRYLSGVPMLERDMDKKNGGDRAYKAYKRDVPCFIPFIGGKS